MEHISNIIIEDITHPSSPNTGVSQSKFLSPCRRVGLKRSSNKFVLKFKETNNPKESNESTKNTEGNKKCIISTADDPSHRNHEICTAANINNPFMNDEEIIKKVDCFVESVNKTVIPKYECDNNENNHADGENIIYSNNFLEKNKHDKKKQKNSDVKKQHDIYQTVNESFCDEKNNVRNCPSPDLMDLKKSCDQNIPESCNKNLLNVITKNDEILSEKSISNNFTNRNLAQCYLKNLVPDIVNTTNKILSSTINYTDNTGEISSLCDSPNRSDINYTNDLKMEFAPNVSRTPCNTNLRTKTFKRFKNPMKYNFVVKKLKIETDNSEFSDIEKRISEKEKKIAELKVTIANSTKHDINHLDSLISKWRNGCQEALAQLLAEIKQRGSEDYNLDKLLAELNIPHELVHYSVADQDFY